MKTISLHIHLDVNGNHIYRLATLIMGLCLIFFADQHCFPLALKLYTTIHEDAPGSQTLAIDQPRVNVVTLRLP